MSKHLTTVIGWLLAITVAVLIACNTSTGVASPRIANPVVTEAGRTVVADLHRWAATVDIGTSVLLVVCAIAFAFTWRKHPRHPNLLMLLAGTTLVCLDPPANWVSFVVYNPELWHYPEDWPWMSVSPSVEPLVDFAYATVLVGPVFIAMPILRRIQARYPTDAFVWRHPLLTLSAVTFVLGFFIDALVELFSVSTRIYTYSQIPRFGSIFTGQSNQFPLLLESSLVPLVIICAAVLLYRDDTGLTQAEKLAQRLRFLPGRPALASFLVMFGLMSATYTIVFGGSWFIIRAGGFADSVACPWPYPQIKVYDPQGFYEKAGHPGPYFEGRWNTEMLGQPPGQAATQGSTGAGTCETARR
jgi:hypothetical protein